MHLKVSKIKSYHCSLCMLPTLQKTQGDSRLEIFTFSGLCEHKLERQFGEFTTKGSSLGNFVSNTTLIWGVVGKMLQGTAAYWIWSYPKCLSSHPSWVAERAPPLKCNPSSFWWKRCEYETEGKRGDRFCWVMLPIGIHSIHVWNGEVTSVIYQLFILWIPHSCHLAGMCICKLFYFGMYTVCCSVLCNFA